MREIEKYRVHAAKKALYNDYQVFFIDYIIDYFIYTIRVYYVTLKEAK